MSLARYTLTYGIFGGAALALILGSWWTLFVPITIFVVIPALELVLGASTVNLTREEEKDILSRRAYDYILYSMVPLQYGLVSGMLYQTYTGALSGWELLGALWSVGICSGTLGINVAHELGHRRKRYEQVLAKMLLLSSLYMHFFVEHNRGHHARVATEDDPASSRVGEWVYTFWFRSVLGGMISAWGLESERLKRKGLKSFSLKNEVLRMFIMEAALVLGILACLGPFPMLCFLVTSTSGIALLETVNYIEHYGLRRQRNENGKWGAIKPIHSWNSDHTVGRGILFELTRHSDHHANPQRKYPILRHFDDSPQLPTGYPGMMVLAMVPPLFFAVMHRRIAEWQGTVGRENTAIAPELQLS